MPRIDAEFKENVFRLVGRIPEGSLMTYGQIAAYCGAPYAAWEVGQIAHYNRPDLPWHRVVNKKGHLARGFTQGIEKQKKLLQAEGVKVNQDYCVDITLLWMPKN